jgi:hypothetical protein
VESRNATLVVSNREKIVEEEIEIVKKEQIVFNSKVLTP